MQREEAVSGALFDQAQSGQSKVQQPHKGRELTVWDIVPEFKWHNFIDKQSLYICTLLSMSKSSENMQAAAHEPPENVLAAPAEPLTCCVMTQWELLAQLLMASVKASH